MKTYVSNQSGRGVFIRIQNSPWNHFFEAMESQGFEFISDRESADVYIAMNHSPKELQCFRHLPIKNKFLVIFEPKIVRPSSHKMDNRLKYSRCYVPSRQWVLSSNDFVFNWPQTDPESIYTPKPIPATSSKIGFIQTNNFSVIQGEQYSLRRAVLRKLQNDIEVSGRGWNGEIFWTSRQILASLVKTHDVQISEISIKGLRGAYWKYSRSAIPVADKFEFLSKHKFTLVIENSLDYVSEKLIDAVIAGSIPIYVGPSLKDHGFPGDIASSALATADSIAETIKELKSNVSMQERLVYRGKEYLSGDQFKDRINSTVLRNLGLQISRDIFA